MITHILGTHRKNGCRLDSAVIPISVLSFRCAVTVHLATVAAPVLNRFKGPGRGDAVSHAGARIELERRNGGGFRIGYVVYALREIALLRRRAEG